MRSPSHIQTLVASTYFDAVPLDYAVDDATGQRLFRFDVKNVAQ